MSSEWFLRLVWALAGGGFLAAVPSRPARFGWLDAALFAVLGLATLAPAVPGFPRGEAPTARADADAVVVPLGRGHRLARALLWGGFTVAALLLAAASLDDDAWEVLLCLAVAAIVARPAWRAARALGDDRVGALLLTPQAVSLDGGRRWTSWEETTRIAAERHSPYRLLPVLVVERARGRRRTRMETALPLRADELQAALRRLSADPSRLAGPVGVEAFRSVLT